MTAPCGWTTTAITTWTCSCWARVQAFQKRRQGRLRGPYGRFPFVAGRALRGEVLRWFPIRRVSICASNTKAAKRSSIATSWAANTLPPRARRARRRDRFWLASGGLRHGDFDADGRVDAVAVAMTAVFTSSETKRRGGLPARPTGRRKESQAGASTEVEVKAGLIYEKQMYAGVPLVFDLEDKPEVDMVRITWPNGLIQSEAGRPRIAQRLQGVAAIVRSCPMIGPGTAGFEFIRTCSAWRRWGGGR